MRTERGPRQRVVAHLGELKASEESGRAHLARRLDHSDRPQPSLFDPPAEPESQPGGNPLAATAGLRQNVAETFGPERP